MFGQEYRNMEYYLQKKGTSAGGTGGFGLGVSLELFKLWCNRSSTSGCCRFNLCRKSYSSGNKLKISLKSGTSRINESFLFWGPDGPGVKRFPPPPPPPSLLLLLLLFFYAIFFCCVTYQVFFCFKFFYWLARQRFNKVSVCLFF